MRISDWSSDVCSSDLQSLAQELAPMKIRVNSVAPGAIRTPINAPAWNTPESLASLLKLIPYGRIGEPDDVARAVELGRASCRARVCQYVSISVVAVYFKKKKLKYITYNYNFQT